MKTITQAKFVDLLLDIKGARAISFSALSDARLRAPYNDVICYAHVNGMINVNYENSVNKQRAKEGKLADFVAESLPYGKWYKNSKCLIEQPNKPLQVRLKRECIYYRFYIRVGQRLNGKLWMQYLPYSEIEPYLPREGISVRQRLSKEVVVRNYNLNNICFATVNGTHYRIR